MLASAEEFAPATTAELARSLQENARGPKSPMVPAGGRTSLRFGEPVTSPAKSVSTSALTAVVDYPARDLTITVEAGIRMADLQKLLATEGQRLPIDVPDSRRATLGGAIASNASGPRRFAHGTFRDYVIGISAVDGMGRPFSAGGRVVKNVAGYDLCKLLVGSLGTLAVITQVTLKLRPVVESQCALWMTAKSAAELDAVLTILNQSATRPTLIDVVNRPAAAELLAESRIELQVTDLVLVAAFEGTPAECGWQMEKLESEVGRRVASCTRVTDPSAGNLIAALGEFQAAGDDPVTVAASVPASKTIAFVEQAARGGLAIQAHAANGIIVGHLPDSCVSAAVANEIIAPLRRTAESAGGSLVVWNCDDAWKPAIGVFGVRRPARSWMASVKRALDPHGILSPGRLPI
jgi:glycolate oxidase FAD binding subunit